MHLIVFAVAAIATLIARFVLAPRMRLLDGWRDLAPATRAFGWLLVAGMIVALALSGTGAQGWAQRALAVVVVAGVVVLAERVLRCSTD